MAVEKVFGDIRYLDTDVIIAAIFEDERPPMGLAGLMDWYLCGFLSELIISGKVTGEKKEAVLIATQGKVIADKLMVFGYGRKENLDGESLEEILSLIAEKAGDLKAEKIVLELTGDRAGGFFSTDETKKIEQIFESRKLPDSHSKKIMVISVGSHADGAPGD